MPGLNYDFMPQRLRWCYSPEDCTLLDDEVHVWIADLDAVLPFEEYITTLSLDENERAARFHFERDRQHFLAARGVLRAILSGYTKIPAASLRFAYGKNGKPGLANAQDFGNLSFNLSHSSGLALYAVTLNRAIGVDMEKVRAVPEMEEIVARYFSAEERTTLQFLDAAERERVFFRHWTRIEAQLKCIGQGFSDECESRDEFDGLIQEIEPAEGYIAALAVRGKPFTIKTWQFRCESAPRLFSSAGLRAF